MARTPASWDHPCREIVFWVVLSPGLRLSALLTPHDLTHSRLQASVLSWVSESRCTATWIQEQLLAFAFPGTAVPSAVATVTLWPRSRHQNALWKSWPARWSSQALSRADDGVPSRQCVTARLMPSVCSSYGNLRSSLSEAAHTRGHFTCC